MSVLPYKCLLLDPNSNHVVFVENPIDGSEEMKKTKQPNHSTGSCVMVVDGYCLVLCWDLPEGHREGWIKKEYVIPLHQLQPMQPLKMQQLSSQKPPLYVLIQRRSWSVLFAGLFGLPGGCSEPKDNGSSINTASREFYEESGFILPADAKCCSKGENCDYFSFTIPENTKPDDIKDKHETQHVTGKKLKWVNSVGGHVAFYGHAWVPVNAFYHMDPNVEKYFMNGIPRKIRDAHQVFLGKKLPATPRHGKNGFVIAFSM